MRSKLVFRPPFAIATIVLVLSFGFVTAHAQSPSTALATVHVETVLSGVTPAKQDSPLDQLGNVVMSGTLSSIGDVDLLGAVYCGGGPNCLWYPVERPLDSMCGSLNTVAWCLRAKDGRAWTVDLPTLGYGSPAGALLGVGQTVFTPAIADPIVGQIAPTGVATQRIMIVTPFQGGTPLLNKTGQIFIQVDGFLQLYPADK